MLDIGKKDVVLGLFWLKETGFVVDPMDRCLRNVSTTLIIACSVRWINTLSLLNLKVERLEEGEVLLILAASKEYCRYVQAFYAQQAATLPEDRSCDHKISLQNRKTKIPPGVIYKTTWEEYEALQTYLKVELPLGKVRYSISSTSVPILFA